MNESRIEFLTYWRGQPVTITLEDGDTAVLATRHSDLQGKHVVEVYLFTYRRDLGRVLKTHGYAGVNEASMADVGELEVIESGVMEARVGVSVIDAASGASIAKGAGTRPLSM